MKTIPSLALARTVSALALGLLFHVATPAFADGHRFACADYIQGKVFIVGTDGKVEWEYPALAQWQHRGVELAGAQSIRHRPASHEVTPDKKVVWTFADHKTMCTVSSVQLLDVPGDAIRGEVLR